MVTGMVMVREEYFTFAPGLNNLLMGSEMLHDTTYYDPVGLIYWFPWYLCIFKITGSVGTTTAYAWTDIGLSCAIKTVPAEMV